MFIPMEIVADYINNWVTGMIEATDSQSVKSDAHYVLAKDWINSVGHVTELVVTGKEMMDSYNKHGRGQLPSWIVKHPSPEDFAKRIFLYLIS